MSLEGIFISAMEGSISLNQYPRSVWRRWGNQLQPDPSQTHQWINEAEQASLIQTLVVCVCVCVCVCFNLRLSSKISQLIGLGDGDADFKRREKGRQRKASATPRLGAGRLIQCISACVT